MPLALGCGGGELKKMKKENCTSKRDSGVVHFC